MSSHFPRLLSAVIFSLCSLCSHGQCETEIRDFYVTYMHNAESDPDANVALMSAHMSPELIARLDEYTRQYDADAVIHAQDVCSYAVSSLLVLPLETHDWYMVKYRWSPESRQTCIPVKAICSSGRLTILDIDPICTVRDDTPR